jgi:hypothetical protein
MRYLIALSVAIVFLPRYAHACCGNDMAVSPWPQQAPAQYNRPYRGHLTVRTGTEAQIHQWCGGYFARACAMPHGSSCTIFLPAPTHGSAPQILEAMRQHEIAHCNGWQHGGH